MCGLAGLLYYDRKEISKDIVLGMTKAIAHRGPDGEGIMIDGSLGLGHRRLAIIDLSPEAAQPMLTDDGQYAIIFNGEIYNFLEIRRELECCGVRFSTKSDTEVALKGFIHWGPQIVERLNGMFAVAIWDKNKQQLFLARDRYGIKPLYYLLTNDMFAFASEQKAITKIPEFNGELDNEALIEYFTFQNIFTNKTFMKSIKMFPAGHWATISKSSKLLNINKYWDFKFREPDNRLGETEYIEELDRLFNIAVNRQLVSDVEIGSFLSGGIDSGAITSIAASKIPYIKTFTCGFDLTSASGLELGFDERQKAEYMSYLFRTEHYELVLKAGDMERALSKLAWHIEEPRVGQSYPNYYASRLASKFVKVALAGTGGDELFGGYPWRYYRAVVNTDFEQYIDKYYFFWQRLIPSDLMKDFFKPISESLKNVDTRQVFKNVFQSNGEKIEKPEDYVNHSMYFEAKTFLHGLLVVEDKLSMANGLETRVPFLDNDLVDFALNVPVNLKLKSLSNIVQLNENEPGLKTSEYYNKTGDGKLLLRKTMQKYIPDLIINDKKQGFSAPDASWFRGESIDYVRKVLFDRNNVIYNYIDYNTASNLINDHLSGKINRRLFVWSMLSFTNYCKQFPV